MTDPVRALHPRTVVPAARRLESGLHRQKILDRDGALLRIREVRKVLPDRLVQRQQLPVRCDADERGDDALGHGLDVGRTRLAAAVEVALENDDAAMRNEKAVESWKLGGRLDRRIQRRRRADIRLTEHRAHHGESSAERGCEPCSLHPPSIKGDQHCSISAHKKPRAPE